MPASCEIAGLASPPEPRVCLLATGHLQLAARVSQQQRPHYLLQQQVMLAIAAGCDEWTAGNKLNCAPSPDPSTAPPRPFAKLRKPFIASCEADQSVMGATPRCPTAVSSLARQHLVLLFCQPERASAARLCIDEKVACNHRADQGGR